MNKKESGFVLKVQFFGLLIFLEDSREELISNLPQVDGRMDEFEIRSKKYRKKRSRDPRKSRPTSDSHDPRKSRRDSDGSRDSRKSRPNSDGKRSRCTKKSRANFLNSSSSENSPVKKLVIDESDR